MKRTQIYLPEELHHELMILAKQESTSMSNVIRKKLFEVVNNRLKKKKKSAYDFFDWLIEDGKKTEKRLPKDFSRRHTEYYLETVVKSK